MNYCIIMPKCVRDDNASYIFPVGIAYVSSALKESGRKVITYNLNYKKDSTRKILEHLIIDNNLDVIASGGLTTQYPELREIFELAKEIKPDIITWVGGGIITASPIPAMEALEYADYGMIGEGEITICELADALEGKRTLESVDGLIFKDYDNKWIITKPRKEIEDLDSISLPDYEGFEYGELIDKANFEVNGRQAGMVSFSRSCPFNCTFCFHSSGQKYRKRSLKNILKEIDYLIEKYQIRSLFVNDELFALRNNDFDEFCNAMKDRNLTYTVSLRVDMVNEEMIMKLKESGCKVAGFGLESADNTILKSMNKHITVEQIDKALDMCLKADLHAQGNFIFGDEAETVETYKNTLNWWKNHPQYNIKLSYISVFPGSILYQNACHKGIITNEVEYIKKGCPQINVSKMTDEEYKKMMLDITVAINKGKEFIDKGRLEYTRAGLANLTGLCPHCGKENMWFDREIFRPVSKLICNHCDHIVDAYPLDYLDKNLYLLNFKRIRKYKAALWGIINSVEALYEYIPEAWEENFYLIDSALKKQGIELHGKVIQSPDIIEEKGLDLIIITFTSVAAGSIYRTILEKYPSVKKIMYLGDFLDPNLEL